MPKRLLHVTHQRQRYPADCLAACAAMVLGFLGQPADYENLIRLLRIDPTVGTPYSNVRLLGALHIEVTLKQGTRADLDTSLAQQQLPIVFLSTGELPYWAEDTFHAVVVVGLDDTSIYLNDPAFETAPQIVDYGDFELAWLNRDAHYVVLTRPSAEKPAEGST